MIERCLSYRVRRILVLLLGLLLFMALPHHAFAADQGNGSFWFGPDEMSTNGVKYYKTGVVASNKYDAALYALGFSKSTVTGISNSKKNTLIGNSTFSSFANRFKTGKPDDDAITLIPGIPTVGLNANSMLTTWYAASAMYGESNCYWSIYSKDSADSAEDAAYKIIKGGSSSGGGSGGSGSVGGGIMDTPDLPDTVELLRLRDIPAAQWQTLDMDISAVKSRNPDGNRYPYCMVQVFSNGVTDADYPINCRVEVLFLTSNDLQYYWDEEYDAAVLVAGVNMSNYEFAGSTTLRSDGTFTPFVYSGGKSWSAQAGQRVIAGGSASYRPVIYASYISQGYTGGGDDEPTEPPIEWPTPTEPPQPPEVPTPGEPTQPTPPDPVTPTPGNPWIPIPDDDIQITGQDFQDLIDALNEHCIHLQNSIQSNVSQLWDLQSDFLGTQFEDLFGQISDNFTWLGNDVITESYNDLKSYLHELFEWLSEQLNFDVQVEGGQYDDTSVLYWLKQIWAKLPTGINTRPTDPVTNPSGWWDWLTQLLNNLAADLMALGHDRLAGVLETLNELRNKFPFSLPWDVAALLGLLVGVPECPEFDMPCYTVSLEGLQQVGTYHVTLEPYETVWEGVKWIETLAFAVYLIMNTGGLMDMVTKTVRPR